MAEREAVSYPFALMIRAAQLCLALAVPCSGLSQPVAAQESTPVQEEQRLLGPGRGLELTLEAAFELALKSSLALKLSQAEAQVAIYRGRGSWGAFDWTVGARAGVRDSEFQPRDVFGGSSENSQDLSLSLNRPVSTGGLFGATYARTNTETDSSFQVEPLSTTDVVTLSYVQPLLRGAWSSAATSEQRLAEIEAERAAEAVRTARQKLLLDVANAYWDLVSAREQLDVAEKSLSLSNAQVDQNRRRLDAGLGTEVEVLQAQADVANREEQRLLREFELRTAMDALRQLLFPGTDEALWDTALVPSTALPDEVAVDRVPAWPVAMRAALEQRPELREQRRRIEAAETRHRRSKSDRLMQLDLELLASSQGFSGDSGKALDTALSFDYPTYRASLVFGYPLGNTTASWAEKAAWAEIRLVRLAYDQLETGIVAEVRAAVRDVLYAAEAVRAARKSLELADRQLKAEQARYAVDQSTNFQVLQFQTDLSTAMANERRARVSYAKSSIRLQSAQGVLGNDLAAR